MLRRAASVLTAFALLLAAPATALALNINEEFKPQNEFKLDPWIYRIGPLDIQQGGALLSSSRPR